ncbi:MAG: hypothetical protein U5O39_17595 [Gammaproteobacteria bacterium]|nr:hypothetical protein [Gammaproteobacteria bacterium]
MQGYRVVRTFGGTQYERDRFPEVSDNNRRQSMKMVVTSSIATPVVAGRRRNRARISRLAGAGESGAARRHERGDGRGFHRYLGGLLAKPIRQLSEVNSTVQQGLAAAQDIFDLFDEQPERDRGTETIDRAAGKIEISSAVAFDMTTASAALRDVPMEHAPVLKDINFTVEPGETIALVGRSGSRQKHARESHSTVLLSATTGRFSSMTLRSRTLRWTRSATRSRSRLRT